MSQIKRLLILVLVFSAISCSKRDSKIIFYDDFQDNSLDTTKWNYELGDGCPELCGWGNNERQSYLKESVNLKDGNLVIQAIKKDSNYFSGKITTQNKVEFKYGTVEVRAKLPTGEGVWPAIWLLGANIDIVGWPASGEIDIMEYAGKNPHEIHTTIHTSESYGNTINTKVSKEETIEKGFHIYKLEWTKKHIKFYIDDQLKYTYAPKDKTPENWPFDQKFYLILNTAIGGNLGGPNVDDTIFPADFIIDYVKIYQ